MKERGIHMKPIKIDTFLDFSFVSNPTFSPDGTLLAYQVQKANLEDNNYKSDLWLYDMAKKKHRRLTAGGDVRSYCWTPQGTILFPAVREADAKKELEKGKLLTCYYEISPYGGEAQEAFRLPVQARSIKVLEEDCYLVTVSHDNQYPDVSGMEPADAEKALKQWKNPPHEVLDELPFWFNGAGFTNGKRTRLYLYQPSTGELTPFTDPWMECGGVSTLGDLILYKGYTFRDVRWNYSGIYLYNKATKENRCLLPQDTMRTGSIELLSETEALVAATDGVEYGNGRYMDFYKMNLADGTMTLCAPYEASIGSGSVGSDARLGGGRGSKLVETEEGRFWYFVTTVDDSAYLRRLNTEAAAGETVQISANLTGDGSCDSFDICGGHTVVCGLYGDRLAELYLDGERITNFSKELEEDYYVATPEYHCFTASDGYEIHGWAMKPYDYDETKKYPAILHIHGGPRTVFGSVFHHEMQMWASGGYFVFYCNPRGSDGRGNAFGDINGKYGTVDYDNLMEFLDQMLAKYPQVDAGRLGVAGGSYGGFMTNWIIGHTDRFAAAASQRSIANWVSFEHISDIGHTFTPDNQASTTRQDVQKLWWHSPLKYADQCKTPTLFIHSDQDYRCHMAEGIAMFSALKMHGCPSRLCLFHGETHELSRSGKPRNRIKRMEEILGWLDKYLQPEKKEA